MATLRATGPYSGFIPQATGQVISYVRSPSEFRLNKYVQYLQTPQPVGVYARVSRDDAARVVTDNDWIWADGADRPAGEWNNLRFQWVEFSVKRRAYPFRIGDMALKSAKKSWDPLKYHTNLVASQAMINRTNRVMTLVQTASNWESNTDSANALSGGAGPWHTASDQPSDPHYNAIRRSLFEAARRINLATNAVVAAKDLVVVISPELAIAMGNSAEIHNYLKHGPFSKAQLEGGENSNREWGLPPDLYGFELIVEDTPYVSSRPAAADTASSESGTRQYAKDATSAVILSRKGGINGNYGAPSFSTLQMYFYEWEMAVFAWNDPRNLRTEGSVVDAFAEVLAAPQAGFLISGCM